jgi:hypothetical protein
MRNATVVVAVVLVGVLGCGGIQEEGDVGVSEDPLLLKSDAQPMPCADPAVFSAKNRKQTFFVYCTGMSHVWKTSDWSHFTDVRAQVSFDISQMNPHGQAVGSWWAPSIVWAPGLAEYVMWVSVPDARAVKTASGWDTRSLAAFSASSPTGPWRYRGIALGATARGQNFIDPFLFRDHDGGHYVFYKRYGGGVSSKIVGARVGAGWLRRVAGTDVALMNGYGGPGTWEDNVRENPAVRYDPATGLHHLLFSGGHWRDGSYATGHALSRCGPLCVGSGGWHMVSSGDRNIVQVIRGKGDANVTFGGPGGAEFQDDTANFIVYAAATLSKSGNHTRYLMRDRIKWANRAPYVDTAGHHPHGY